MAASGTYFINDTLDVAADRHHHVKRLRPIAAGVVPPLMAAVVGVVLMALAIVLAWRLAGSHLALVIAIYVAVTTAYSVRLKHEPVVDLACVSTGFVLPPSPGGLPLGSRCRTGSSSCHRSGPSSSSRANAVPSILSWASKGGCTDPP